MSAPTPAPMSAQLAAELDTRRESVWSFVLGSCGHYPWIERSDALRAGRRA